MLSVRRHAWHVLPLLLLLALYWPGLTNWFYQDDFGWLNLRRDVHSFRDLGPALFAPKAQGNIRPLGESAYFLVFSSLFGFDALPFRVWAFATQMASLVLLGSIAARLAGSRAAGFWTQILWIANPGLAPPMCWTSAYNQVLSGFFFLLAFWFFLRQIESGATRDAVGHWAAFILGLGALETNVVYPVVAAVYALCFARSHLKKLWPMFLVSALVVAAHLRFAPLPHAGVYAAHFDRRMFSTLGTHWMWAMGPSRWAAVLISCAVAGALAWQAHRRQWAGIFGLAWFAIVMGPYLPLSDHKMDYYLAVPVVGLALFGGWTIARAWRSRAAWKVAALACATLYLATALPAAYVVTRWHHDGGTRVKDLVLGVEQIHEAQPGKIILLKGIDSDLFWSAIVDVPFRVMEIPHVYLTPESESRIAAPADLLVKYVLPEALGLPALRAGTTVVYQEENGTLRNITSRYRALAEALWKPDMPRFVNLGDPLFAEYLGAGWDTCADGYRTMRRLAMVRIGGPRSPTDRLYVGVFRTGVFHLGGRVEGMDLPAKVSQRTGELTELEMRLPVTLAGKPEIEVTLASSGAEPLRFGFVELRPGEAADSLR